MIKQCIEALKQRKIQRLTSTYLTLSLDDIAQNAGLSSAKEAEQYVLSMVASGKIFARIEQQDGMVFFLQFLETYQHKMFSRLEKYFEVLDFARIFP